MVIAYVTTEADWVPKGDKRLGAAAGWVVQLEDAKFQGRRLLVSRGRQDAAAAEARS